jgi:hypothetical protein
MISANPNVVFTSTILFIVVPSDTNGFVICFFLLGLFFFFALHGHWVPMNFRPFPSTSVTIPNFFSKFVSSGPAGGVLENEEGGMLSRTRRLYKLYYLYNACLDDGNFLFLCLLFPGALFRPRSV